MDGLVYQIIMSMQPGIVHTEGLLMDISGMPLSTTNSADISVADSIRDGVFPTRLTVSAAV